MAVITGAQQKAVNGDGEMNILHGDKDSAQIAEAHMEASMIIQKIMSSGYVLYGLFSLTGLIPYFDVNFKAPVKGPFCRVGVIFC